MTRTVNLLFSCPAISSALLFQVSPLHISHLREAFTSVPLSWKRPFIYLQPLSFWSCAFSVYRLLYDVSELRSMVSIIYFEHSLNILKMNRKQFLGACRKHQRKIDSYFPKLTVESKHYFSGSRFYINLIGTILNLVVICNLRASKVWFNTEIQHYFENSFLPDYFLINYCIGHLSHRDRLSVLPLAHQH